MDSKEGIEKVTPVDARAVGLLDPSLLQLGADDATTTDPPREWADSPAGSYATPDETPRQESYCLYVRVLRDSDAILEQDRKVPEYCWNAGIRKDIFEARTGVVPGTFYVDLLSDTEFLVYRLLKTGHGMSDHESVRHADLIAGPYLWACSPADVFVTQWTTQQVRRDKATTWEYRRRITVEWLATAQARLQDLNLVAQKRKERASNPVANGRGMIRWADKYLAQQHRRQPEWVPGLAPALPVFPDRAAMLDDYHFAREPSEFEYDTEENNPEDPAMALKRMMMMPLWVPTRHISRVVMIRTKPVEPIPLTGIRGAISRNAKRVRAGIPPMLRRKRRGIRVKWSCLCSGTPLKRAH